MRILFLSRWFPYPADNGAKTRVLNLVKSLCGEHEVALVSFATEEVAPSSVAAMQAICHDVRIVAYRDFRPAGLKARLGFFSPTPRSVIDTYNRAMLAATEEVAATWQPEIVIASEIDMAPYALATDHAVRVLEELELAIPHDAYYSEQGVARYRKRLTWWKLEGYLRRTLSAFDLCTVVSARERDLVKQVCPDGPPVYIVPNGADLATLSQVQAAPTPGTLIYSGALSYHANYDAVHYFLVEVFPLILAQAPNTRLLVTGSTHGVALERLPQCPNVTFTGYLDNIWSAVAGSWVSVVPLRLGGGTRLKVLESLALGTPVVATPKGVEGLDLRADEEVLVGADPRSFADKTLSLLNDANLRQQLSTQGRRAVTRYDWASIGLHFNHLLAEASARRQTPFQP